jgi:DNA topoisomerase-1
MKLLIVESPAKCKKIASYLGAGWRVQATMGHIRSLKEDLTAIGFDPAKAASQAWCPTYESIKTKSAAITNLRKAAAGTEVYLGSDDDREGEAIAWHTCALLGLDPATTPRVVFHEITEPALRAAVTNPRTIDMNKFNAQQARTMLDMLIGFTLSPCLWRGVGFKAGLSAGRCQTPALRIIYDRDREIEGHEATLSWRLTVASEHDLTWRGTEDLADEVAANALLTAISQGNAKSKAITLRDRQERVAVHKPPAPFITSSLQQEASSRLGMQPKMTMKAAQTLYEAGHITYMRTDNAVLSAEAQTAAEDLVRERWGAEFVAAPAAPKKVVKKKAAAAAQPQGAHGTAASVTVAQPQAAHEAIRPTHMEVTELTDVSPTEQRLYDLIWKRTIQSVMAPEQRDTVRLTATLATATVETTYDQTRFAGWRILDATPEIEAADAAAFAARATLTPPSQVPWTTVIAMEARSAPPSRYTEASLIRELEGRGIGRPSTYATLVETVLERGYVEKSKIAATPVTLRGLELTAKATKPKAVTRTEKVGAEKDKLRTTPLGRTVIEWLQAQFGDMIDYDFTANMEAHLDEISRGARPWDSVLTETWQRYAERYATVMATPKVSSTDGSSSGKRVTANKAEFGDGYKLVVSKKGPLFVLEREGQPTRFAPVPGNLSVQTATRVDAEAAFAVAAANDVLGDLDGSPVVRKKGPYGTYVAWGTVKLNCGPTDTLADLEERLRAKVPAANAVDHTVGPYRIKRGPYGLYMYRQPAPGSKTKPAFVGIPEGTPWATLTPESAEQVYKHALEAKGKNKANAFKGRGARGQNKD